VPLSYALCQLHHIAAAWVRCAAQRMCLSVDMDYVDRVQCVALRGRIRETSRPAKGYKLKCTEQRVTTCMILCHSKPREIAALGIGDALTPPRRYMS
jgi:hypothetical protein